MANRLLLREGVLWVLMATAFGAAALVFALDGNLDTWVRVTLALVQLLAAVAAILHALTYRKTEGT